MAIYTLSMNFIDGISGNHSHLHNVFLRFPNPDCEHKAAMDKSKRLFNIYANASANNVDLLKWLEWMSHTPDTYFEIIDIVIPEETPEEEIYLMVASATKAYKKIIVGNHQCWQNFDYINGCNKIVYNDREITILDREEAYKELNDSNKIVNNINLTTNNMAKKSSPWASGLFYLFVAVVIFSGLAVISNMVHWVFLPIIIIGGVLIIGVIGALQLRNDDKLKENNFLTLMVETYKRLPLLKKGK
jgi:hypothetical protein